MFDKNLCLGIEAIDKDVKELELTERVLMIGNEGIIEAIDSVSIHINKGLDGMVKIYNNLFNFSNQIGDINYLSGDVKIIVASMNKIRNNIGNKGPELFDTISTIELPVILGLKVDGPKLLNSLKPLLKEISQNYIAGLKETSDFIAKLIVSEETRLSTRIKFNIDLYKLNRDLYANCLDMAIDANGTKDRMRFDKFFNNMRGLEECVKLVSEDEKLLDVKHLEDIKKLTLEVSESVDSLHSFIKENPKTSINRNMLYELAERLDLMANLTTNVMSVIFIFKSTIETIKEAVRVVDKNL